MLIEFKEAVIVHVSPFKGFVILSCGNFAVKGEIKCTANKKRAYAEVLNKLMNIMTL